MPAPTWILDKEEGQFFERKSCLDRSSGRPRRRRVAEVAKDIAETLVAFANADGGTLVLGMENDLTVTGVDYPPDRLAVLQGVGRTHVVPALGARVEVVQHKVVQHKDGPVLLLEVDWSPDVHRTTDGRYLLRSQDKNLPFAAGDIEGMKAARRRRFAEQRFFPDARLADIEPALVERLISRTGSDESVEETLGRYRLLENNRGKLVPSLAALLLFGKDPGHWHPRAGIDYVRYEGTERKLGAAFNAVKRRRFEGPLLQLIEDAYDFVGDQVPERHGLVDLFFEERLGYPAFAWQEAIVNAVAHRDYGLEGIGIEIWQFDDRLEIRSPGELVEPVTFERLRSRERLHSSRNPRIVRVLTDIGLMQEQGEGVPRMFEEMERSDLYPPELRLDGGAIFNVTLKNTPVFGQPMLRWLRQFESLGLSGNQMRLLAFAHEHGERFTSRDYQQLAHVDMYAASRDIRDLVRKGVVRLPQKGGRLYEVLASPLAPERPPEYAALEAVLARNGYLTNADIRAALRLSRRQAVRIADNLVGFGLLVREGRQRGTRYVAPPKGESVTPAPVMRHPPEL